MNKNLLPLLLIAFLGSLSIHAQPITQACSSPQWLGADFCDFTCVNCMIDGFTGTNAVGPPTNQIYCGQITVHNPVWLAFVAGSEEINLEVIPFNCNNFQGLQLAVFEQCNDMPIGCHPGSSMGALPLQFVYDQYIPGKTYYLMIDGYAQDICEFTIHVLSGSVFPPPPGNATMPNGPSSLCIGMTGHYSIPPVPGAGFYHWIAPPGAKINGLSNEEYINAPEGEEVDIQFSNIGGQVCVIAGSVCTTETAPSCKNVQVVPVAITNLAPVTVNFNDLPYVWPQDGITTLTNPGVFILTDFNVSYIGCDSIVRQTITVNPPGNGFVTGTLFIDANNNGIRDAGEIPFSNPSVIKSSSGELSNSGLDGVYAFNNLSPGDTIFPMITLPGFHVNPAFHVVQQGVWNGYDFAITNLANAYDLAVSLSTTSIRPGFSSLLTLVCQNNGLQAVNNAMVSLTLPDPLGYQAATVNPFSAIGNVYTWNLGTMSPGEITIIKVQVYTPEWVQLGTIKEFTAVIKPDQQDANPVNNVYTLSQVIVGSFDPNDKQVNPAYVTPGMINNGQPFEYNIRFQNTGNYQADFVRVIDTLGNMVDPASFRFIASSHPCTWTMRGHGVVEFLFENINLPDSSSNEVESHGFVTFSVKPKSGLPLGTVIENYCDIYFDFNPPVRTNTAGTQVVYFVPGEGLGESGAFRARPNPAVFYTRFEWKSPAPAPGRIRLFNVTGLPVLEIPIAEGSQYIFTDVGNLVPGLYFAVFESGTKVMTTKLVIVSLVPLDGN